MSKAIIVSLTSIVIILLAGVCGFLYITNFTPEAKANKVSTQYMDAVLANNPQDTASISEIDDKSRDIFFDKASLRNYRLISKTKTNTNNTFYFLYDFTDKEKPKKARIAVKNNKVADVKTGNNLGKTPAKDGPEDNDKTTLGGSCLTADDLAFIDSSDLYAHNFRAMTMIFSDSTSLTYAGEANGERIITRLVDFYKKSGKKDFLIELRGYATDDPVEYITMTELAQNRSDKMRKEMVTRGITPDRIQIKNPTVYAKDDNKADSRRNYIDINIINQCR